MTASLAAGHPVTIPITPGIADGLLAVRPGDLTFEHARAFVDRIVLMDDPSIVAALKWLFREVRIVAEPSGAITVAAAMADAARGDQPPGQVVAVISGGNVEPESFARFLGSPDAQAG